MQQNRHFDVVIVGAGSGESIIDEQFGERSIALIDQGVGAQGRFGGTCLNTGCIPSKMLSAPAELAITPLRASRLGVNLQLAGVDWAGIHERVFGRLDARSQEALAKQELSRHVTVFQETARFVDPHTLQLGGQRISGDVIVLAAGSRPKVPDIPGVDDPDLAGLIHTSETIMRAPLPRRLVILGGGIEAVEFAHIFDGLGSEVTLINRSDRLLRRSDDAIATRITEVLGRRVTIRLNQRVSLIEAAPDGGLYIAAEDHFDIEYSYQADAVLLCLGRTPNSDILGVAKAGVRVNDCGHVEVDDYQRTNVDHIWALGDICSHWQLKHVANAEARVVQHNLLNPNDMVKADHRFVPAGIFGSPQIAQVGATESDLLAQGRDYVVYMQNYADVAMGWALEDQDHFAKLLADPRTGRLLGAHIIGPEACALLQPLSQAMHFPVDIDELGRGQYWVHPAMTEVVENALLGLQAVREQWLAERRPLA